MTSAHDTQRATDGGVGPIPEANRRGHRPEVEQDKPFDKFAALADRADGSSGTVADEEHVRSSSASARSKAAQRALLAVAVVGVLAWVLQTVLDRRRTTRTDHLVRTVRGTMADTVDHVKDTVDHMKDTVDHVKDAVVHVKDRLPV